MQYDGIKGTKLRVQIWCKARLHKVQNCGANGKQVQNDGLHMVNNVDAKWYKGDGDVV